MKRLFKAIKIISEGGSFWGHKLYTAEGAVVPGIGKVTEAKWRVIEKRMDEKAAEIKARNSLVIHGLVPITDADYRVGLEAARAAWDADQAGRERKARIVATYRSKDLN